MNATLSDDLADLLRPRNLSTEEQFYGMLYPPGIPGYRRIWTLQDRKSGTLGNGSETFQKVQATVSGLAKDKDVYYQLATRSKDLPSSQRGGKKDCAAAAVLWADQDWKDFLTKEEASPYYIPPDDPKNEEDAWKKARERAIQQNSELRDKGKKRAEKSLQDALDARLLPAPSAVICSGNGHHPYWSLQTHVLFDSEETRDRFEAHLRGIAKACKGDMAATDIARVLRVPGTLNHKTNPPKDVILESFTPERRYSLEDFPSEVKPTPPKPAAKQDLDFFSFRAGDDFNVHGPAIQDMLTKHGWQIDRTLSDGRIRLTRPDKTEGTSGSISKDGRYFYVFTTSTTFEANTAYSKFAVYTVLCHDGDFHAAAQDLWNEGYGARLIRLPLNDAGNADRLILVNWRELRHCEVFGKAPWLIWDGCHWRRDESGQAMEMAKDAMYIFNRQAKHALKEADTDERKEAAEKVLKFSTQSLNQQKLTAALKLASSDESVAVTSDQLDQHPYLLAFTSGTVDLRTGELLPPDPKHLITKLVRHNYDPSAQCPKFLEFLNRIMNGDQSLVDYLQKALGYSLTADTAERAIFVCHGSGANGKTTLLSLIHELIDGYSAVLQVQSLIRQDKDDNNAQSDLADLRGARFVMSSETDQGMRFSEAKLKRLTQGNGIIKAARKFENHITFPETHKLWLDCNHKPEISGNDPAIWERLHLIPFTVTIPREQRDRELKSKLRTEAEGILAWLVQGAVRWTKEGLQRPEPVSTATCEWQEESNHVRQFIQQRCEQSVEYAANRTQLWNAFDGWQRQNVDVSSWMKVSDFYNALETIGFKVKTVKGNRLFGGIQLIPEGASDF